MEVVSMCVQVLLNEQKVQNEQKTATFVKQNLIC